MTAGKAGDRIGASGLDSMFSPSSLAIAGMSRYSDTFAGRLYANLRRSYMGDLFLVNPSYDELGGEPCYRSLNALPGGCVPDAALIVTGAETSVGLLRQCETLGVRAATIFAAGFGEAQGGGSDRAAALESIIPRVGSACAVPTPSGWRTTSAARS